MLSSTVRKATRGLSLCYFAYKQVLGTSQTSQTWTLAWEPAVKLFICSVGQEDPLEEEMATHASILAWRIPWTEEPGGLQGIYYVLGSPKSLQMVTAAMKLNDACSLEEKL